MGTAPLIPEQRRQQILDLLRTEPVLGYRQLTDRLGVSQMPVRRDVATLDEQGRARATQVGVAALARLLEEPPRSAKAEVIRGACGALRARNPPSDSKATERSRSTIAGSRSSASNSVTRSPIWCWLQARR